MPFLNSKTDQPAAHKDRLRIRIASALMTALDETSPVARRWAARDLVNCPEAAPALLARLKVEPVMSVREVILTSLVRLKNVAIVEGLADCLRSEDVALRNAVVESMKQFPAEMAPIMRKLLFDENPDVRIFAINILEALCHPDVEKWLIEVIDAETHVNVCAAAIDLLAEVGTELSRKHLEKLRYRFADEPYFQFAIDLAVGRICGV